MPFELWGGPPGRRKGKSGCAAEFNIPGFFRSGLLGVARKVVLMPGPDRQSGCCADARRRMLRPGSPLSSLFRREGRAVGREGTWLGVRASLRQEFGAGALRLTPAGRCAPPLRSGARPLVPLGNHSGFALIFSLVRKRAGEEERRRVPHRNSGTCSLRSHVG